MPGCERGACILTFPITLVQDRISKKIDPRLGSWYFNSAKKRITEPREGLRDE
jgi:hypothetical protein